MIERLVPLFPSMRQDFPSTSQDLIRALKAPADPPSGHGHSKIRMAFQAWSESTLYFPNKDQVIADWVLTRFLKEKDKPSSSNPLLDINHWRLLSSIISCSDPEGSRRVKAWLTPLLNRTPLAPILIAILNQIPRLPTEIQTSVLTSFTPCFSILWPLAKHKINVETLLECFSATLKIVCLNGNQTSSKLCITVCSTVASTYLSALTRASNRKKLSSTFLSSHLEPWLRCVPALHRSGLNDLYAAGAETLFAPETLRQLVDDPVSNTLIQALSRIDSAVVLPSLPALLDSFHDFVICNRTGLFPRPQQGTDIIADHVRESIIGFYNACDGLICASRIAASDVWDSRLRSLSIIERKNVFSGAQQRFKLILSDKCRLTVDELRSQTIGTPEVILKVICCFARIDFDLVSPHVPSVLPVVAKLPSSSKAAAEFLDLGADYHRKSRTLPAYFSMILDALGQTSDSISSSDSYDTYTAVLEGPMFEDSRAQKLRKTLRGFVTPGQCLGFLAQTRSTLGRVYSGISGQQSSPGAEKSARSRKRREPDLESSICSPAKAINFAFVCSVIAIVWPSLPLHSLVDESRLEALNEIKDVDKDIIVPILSTGLKRKRNEEGSASRSWLWDVITSSALRLRYALSVCTSLNFQPIHDTKTESRMLRLLESSDVLPELKLEIGQSLLTSASLGSLRDVEKLVGKLLSCIEPVDISSLATWDSKTFKLSRRDKNARQSSIALLYILSHRWLPTLSGGATAEDLKRFVRLLFSPLCEGCSVEESSTQETENFMAIMPFRFPAFWELPELRTAVLNYMSEGTSHLDVTDMVKTLETLPQSPNLSLDIHGVQGVYAILRYTPMEYLPKSVRIDLTKKAVVFDGQLMSMSKQEPPRGHLTGVLSLSREYIGRSLAQSMVFDRAETDAVTKYFLDPRWDTPADCPTFPSAVTEEMIRAHLSTVFKSYRPDDELGMLTIIESVQVTAAPLQHGLRQRLLTIVLDTVTRSSQISRFSPRVCQGLRSLFSSALRATKEQILRSISTSTLGEEGIALLATDLKLWCTLISFRAWISDFDLPIPRLAVVVTKAILSFEKAEPASSWSTLHNRAALVSLSELSTVSADEAQQASEIFLTIYLSLCHVNKAAGLDDLVGNSMRFRSLPVYVFETVLNKISEFSSETATSIVDMVSMVRLSQALLRNAPEGTMKVTQKHTTNFLNLFSNRQCLLCTDISASLEICRFISNVCTEWPAALQPGDVMLTWTIISGLLSDSENHDSATSTDIFREVVGIAGALIRHRRDLVLPGLPHLSMILQRLVTMIRAIRPGLGAKQARTVANSFPFWVNVREPLGNPEVKVLSRLLVSLTTKTAVRLVGSTQENQKMESLARPFGKHSSYVLVAYVQAMSDPLCVVYAATRKELYPGLFALCDMLSDHDREALMLSALDGSGKATMKTLWNDYKKQKYVGQG